jgi:hypothetical protein
MVRTNRLLALWLAAGAVLLASVPGTPAHADDKDKKTKELNREPVNCVQANSISRKVAIDAKTIVFGLKGNKFYRVDLPGGCPTLTPGETQLRLVYDNRSGKMARLCSTDSFGVEHRPGTGCGLAKFNPITAEEAEALIATTKSQ